MNRFIPILLALCLVTGAIAGTITSYPDNNTPSDLTIFAPVYDSTKPAGSRDGKVSITTLKTVFGSNAAFVAYTSVDRAKQADLTAHTGNTSNPHSVTAAQAGAATLAAFTNYTSTDRATSDSLGDYSRTLKPADIITKGPWVDVRAFGAIGDGVADDTSAIQAAINTGKAVYFPLGVYKTTSALTMVTDGQTLFGAGVGSVIKKTGAGNILELNGTDATTNALQHPVVRDLAFDGTDKAVNGSALMLHYVWNGKFERLYFKNVDKGVYLRGAQICEFSSFTYQFENYSPTVNYIVYANTNTDYFRNADNNFHDFLGAAAVTHLHLEAKDNDFGGTAIMDGFNVDNCIFFGGAKHIYAKGLFWSTITNNKFFQPGNEHLTLVDSGDCTIANNTFVWNAVVADYWDAIKITGRAANFTNAYNHAHLGGNHIITGNRIYEPSGHGISATYAGNLTITGNDIFRPNYNGFYAGASKFQRDGINLDYCKGGLIEGNNIYAGAATNAASNVPRLHRWGINLGTNTNGIVVKHYDNAEVLSPGANTLYLTDEDRWKLPVLDTFLNYESYPEAINSWFFYTAGGGSNPTITANNTTAPDGSVTADKVQTTLLQSGVMSVNTITVNAGDIWTYSIYMKADADTFVDLRLTNNSGTTDAVEKQVHVGTTWKRYTISLRYTTGSTSTKFIVGNLSDASAGVTFYAWGGQWEKTTQPGPYLNKKVHVSAMPTTGAWKQGDWAINTAPTAGTPTSHWLRVTTGTGNVLDTDWKAK